LHLIRPQSANCGLGALGVFLMLNGFTLAVRLPFLG
jgi:hypothetical protein